MLGSLRDKCLFTDSNTSTDWLSGDCAVFLITTTDLKNTTNLGQHLQLVAACMRAMGLTILGAKSPYVAS